MAELLRVEQVTKTFGGGDVEATEVLRGVNLELGAGESLAVLGASGSGKSTLLAICGTLETPSAGRVLFEGRDLDELGERELAVFRNKELGFVFQHHHLLPQLSALENVLVPTLAQASKRSEAAIQRARMLLDRVGLGARVQHRPAELSGGERQRVAVVRSVIQSPRLLLADEPTGSLDARSAGALGDLLCELCDQEGVALLLVTHSAELAGRMRAAVELVDGVAHERRSGGETA